MTNATFNANRCSTHGRLQSWANLSGIAWSYAKVFLTLVALVAPLGMSRTARADSYNFSVDGSGIQAEGVIQVSNTGPLGAYTVTGISGLFSDSTNNILGTISGLELAPPPSVFPTPDTFRPPADTTAGFSYDNLFWPGADSPAVCPEAAPFFGGYFDVYGMAFDVMDGSKEYTADLWSNGTAMGGYQLNDSLQGSLTPFTPNQLSGLAYAVNVSAAPTPEPGSLFLVGTGLSGIAALLRRRKRAL